MNLIIINHKKMSYLFNKIKGDGFYFIYDSTKTPIDSLKSHILENDPEKIISLDFAVPITGSLKKKYHSNCQRNCPNEFSTYRLGCPKI